MGLMSYVHLYAECRNVLQEFVLCILFVIGRIHFYLLELRTTCRITVLGKAMMPGKVHLFTYPLKSIFFLSGAQSVHPPIMYLVAEPNVVRKASLTPLTLGP